MKIWTPLFNLLAVLLLVMMSMVYFNESKVIERDFDQVRLNFAVEQATEAMFRATLETEHLDLDYTDLAYAQVNSSGSIEIFDRVICYNYDFSPSKENFDMINQSIVSCVLAGYDGYYVGDFYPADLIERNGTANDGIEFRFSPKIPYLFQAGDNVYAINTYKKTYLNMSTADATANPVMFMTGGALPMGITESDVAKAVNEQIMKTSLRTIKNGESLSGNDLTGYRYYLPDQTTVTGVNPFDLPGIILLMGKCRFASNQDISAISVSGYKVINKVEIIGFVDVATGRAYYCYNKQLNDEEKTQDSGGIAIGGSYGRFKIENYFSTMKEACETESSTGEHYAPYYDILLRKIDR